MGSISYYIWPIIVPRRAARLRIFGMYRAHVLRELALGSPQSQNQVIDPEFVCVPRPSLIVEVLDVVMQPARPTLNTLGVHEIVSDN